MSYHSQSSAPPPPDPYGSGNPYPPAATNYYGQPGYGSHGYSNFPPGTPPEVIRSFQMVDRDRSGFIDVSELQLALSSGYQRFSLDTIRLLMFLFKNPHDSLRIVELMENCLYGPGPKSFLHCGVVLVNGGLLKNLAIQSSNGHYERARLLLVSHQSIIHQINLIDWFKAIFERFDRDRSGKIDLMELRDALYSLGYAIPPSVLQVLISRYDDGSGRRVELDFDSFVQSGMIVKGLTEKFKEKDPRYTVSATLTYDTFMSMIIPFLVA